MSMAHSPAFRWESSVRESELSSGHVHVASGFSEPHLLLTFGLPPFWGLVAGGDFSGRAVRHRKSTGKSVACSAAVAAFRSLAACRFAAMLADISSDKFAFFNALRCLAASFLAAVRAS